MKQVMRRNGYIQNYISNLTNKLFRSKLIKIIINQNYFLKMFLKFQLFSLNIATALLLIFFLCLGSQNLEKRYSLDFLIGKSVFLPIGFIIGSSFALGIISGGLTSTLMINNKINDEN